jgi:hypothetical protein
MAPSSLRAAAPLLHHCRCSRRWELPRQLPRSRSIGAIEAATWAGRPRRLRVGGKGAKDREWETRSSLAPQPHATATKDWMLSDILVPESHDTPTHASVLAPEPPPSLVVWQSRVYCEQIRARPPSDDLTNPLDWQYMGSELNRPNNHVARSNL